MNSLPAATELLDKSSEDLDRSDWSSSPGPMPNGDGNGAVLMSAGIMFGGLLAAPAVAWQGKTFEPKNGFLRNKVTPFRFRASPTTPLSVAQSAVDSCPAPGICR
jgi:hypothetical protein